MDHAVHAEPGHINFSPVGFRRVARDFLSCANGFKPADFSLVPFFLYCRAIELSLKAVHLEAANQQQVKVDFGHDLIASYDALAPEHKVLSSPERDLLERVNPLYVGKRFEYMQVGDAARGFTTFPDLQALAKLAARLVK